MTPPQDSSSLSVKVAVRVRPFNDKERPPGGQEPPPVLNTFPQQSTISVIPENKQFTFDKVFDILTEQEAVFEELVGPLMDKFIEGYNATILAYGQTSSGKTYTMGTANPEDAGPPHTHGIIPRASRFLFDRIQATQSLSLKYSVKVSYIEIYNEDLKDLLSTDKSQIQIREDPKGRIYWTGVREVLVQDAAGIMRQLAEGSWRRSVGSTDMNAHSSRSHAIFSITLRQDKRANSSGAGTGIATIKRSRTPSCARDEQRLTSPAGPRIRSQSVFRGEDSAAAAQRGREDDEGTWSVVTSKFHFVDLAGSERLKRTNAVGDRAKEGISINAGLSALGNVISALGDLSKKTTHIPYRDSKLTRMLQDSLGGNSQTLMIACVSPAAINVPETLNTLMYANRARNIKNKAIKNEEMSTDVVWLQAQVLKLRAELRAIKSASPTLSDVSNEDSSSMLSPLSPMLTESSFSRPQSPAITLNSDAAALAANSFMYKRVRRLEAELQRVNSSYRHLLQQYDSTCAELSKLRSEHLRAIGARRRSSMGVKDDGDEDDDGEDYGQAGTKTGGITAIIEQSARKSRRNSAGFMKDVEPVIEEYEKVVATLEAKLSDSTRLQQQAEEDLRRLRDEVKFAERVQYANVEVISGLRRKIKELEEEVKLFKERDYWQSRLKRGDNNSNESLNVVDSNGRLSLSPSSLTSPLDINGTSNSRLSLESNRSSSSTTAAPASRSFGSIPSLLPRV